MTARANDGGLVARAWLRRPTDPVSVDLLPTFFYTASLPTSDDPPKLRTLSSAMDAMRAHVLDAVGTITELLGEPIPDAASLELGEHRDESTAEFSGAVAVVRDVDGTTHRIGLGNPHTHDATPEPHRSPDKAVRPARRPATHSGSGPRIPAEGF